MIGKDGYIKICNGECRKGSVAGYCLSHCEFKYNSFVISKKKEVATDD